MSRTAPSAEAGLVLTNDGDEGRNYILFETETAALVDPNLDPVAADSWIRLEPGESIEVLFGSIPGWTPAAEAVVVYSWIRSVPHEVAGGIQWLGEGWMTVRIEL